LTEEETNQNENEYILKHSYNPEFRIINEEEIKDVLEKFNIKKLIQLPRMSIKDPVCKLFNAKVGDIFEITRKSYTSGKSIFYRVVVNE